MLQKMKALYAKVVEVQAILSGGLGDVFPVMKYDVEAHEKMLRRFIGAMEGDE